MKKAEIFVNGISAAELIEESRKSYQLNYRPEYKGHPISLTLPLKKKTYHFNQFPYFFEGLLPEGIMLDSLLRTKKIDKEDYFAQLLAVGTDLVGHVTVKETK